MGTDTGDYRKNSKWLSFSLISSQVKERGYHHFRLYILWT